MDTRYRLAPQGVLRMMALSAALTASGTALSYTTTIDSLQEDQGSAGAPAVSQTGPGSKFAAPFSSPTIYGNYRHIGLTNGAGTSVGAYASSWVDKFGKDTPRGTWQVALPTGNTNGFGEIVWNGSSNLADTNLSPLDLTKLQQFTINYLFADHSTTFFMQVYSSPTQCTQAVIADVVGETELTNVAVLPSAFTLNCNGASPANLSSIKKIRIVFTGGQTALDTDFRGLSATFDEPAQVQCVDKFINGQKSVVVDNAGPHNLTVGFTVSNTGGSSSLITVQDFMPPGMTPTGPVACTTPAGFAFGGQTTPDFTWNSSTMLQAGQVATCSFPAVLDNINEGQTVTNLLQAGATGSPFGPNQCRATITRQAPPPPAESIPTMNEWAMMMTAALLALLGGLALRKREG